MRFQQSLCLVLLGMIAALSAAPAGEGDIAPRSERWNLVDAEIRDQLGRECLAGAAVLDDVAFTNGVIEIDVAVDGSRSYPGIVFRRSSEGNYERVYLRPHRAGLYPDAVQYTPVRNGVAGWQLYHGPGYTAGLELPAGEWIHLRLEVHGAQARLFVGDAVEPALEVEALGHGVSSGAIGLLGPKNATACFSGFRYRSDDTLQFDEPKAYEAPPGLLLDWEVSKVYPAARVDRSRYPHFFSIFSAGWDKVTPEASGLVDIAAYRGRSGGGPDLVLARTVVRSVGKQEVALSFGYSDEVNLFLNGKKVFAGQSAYRGRDPSFLGVVGLFDTVVLTLEPGLNEILLMVTETFGGWGFLARAEPSLAPPVREHERAVRVWETSKEFLTPETVLFDSDRDVLYVSNFDVQFARTPEHTGFISRLGLDGAIRDLRWVTDLDAPAGMGIHAGRLYVAERGHLTEIDIERGAIVKRHPIPDSEFLNDLVIDADGTIYLSDTRPSSHRDSRIYRFRDGAAEVWLGGDEISRANGLWIHDGELLVGNSGDGIFKAVSLADRRVRNVASLGAGILDGIRVDGRGRYLVSHWEGQTYRITPAGEVVELLDTMGDGINAADFEYIRERNLLIIPTFVDNRVIAYRLEE